MLGSVAGTIRCGFLEYKISMDTTTVHVLEASSVKNLSTCCSNLIITHLSVVKWPVSTQSVTEQVPFANPDVHRDENALKKQSRQNGRSFTKTSLINSNKTKKKQNQHSDLAEEIGTWAVDKLLPRSSRHGGEYKVKTKVCTVTRQ